jgi:alpha-L-fucosidase
MSEVGEVSQSLISYEKKNWKVKASSNSVTIQLEEVSDIAGMSYIPPRGNTQSIVKGSIQTSNDGKTWSAKETFEFGNLTNDPTRRFHYFKQPVNARFVRIEANRPMDEKVQEFDLF